MQLVRGRISDAGRTSRDAKARSGVTKRGAAALSCARSGESRKSAGRENIVITEIPYQVNKARTHRAAYPTWCKQEDRRYRADVPRRIFREGMRIVIEIKRGRIALILNNLFKQTQQSRNGRYDPACESIAAEARELGLIPMIKLFSISRGSGAQAFRVPNFQSPRAANTFWWATRPRWIILDGRDPRDPRDPFGRAGAGKMLAISRAGRHDHRKRASRRRTLPA